MKVKTHLTEETWTEIARRYTAGETVINLAREFDIVANTIYWNMPRLKVQMRPLGHGSRMYTCDETYFDHIDTEEKAYWLGLMASDGSVSPECNRFEIGLSGLEDRVLIQRFKDALGFTGPVSRKQPSYPGAKPHFRLGVTSKRVVQSLDRLGVTARKSLTLQFPTSDQVPDHLVRHFIRGYFDGDGSVSLKKSGDFILSVTSSKLFIDDLARRVAMELGLVSHIEIYTAPRNPASASLKLGGNLSSFILLDWLYRDATVALPRKEAKYQLCKRLVTEKLSKTENLYNVRTHAKTMNHARQCAKLLGIDLRLNEWNGLSVSRTEQDDIIALYNQGHGIKHIAGFRDCSTKLVRNVLERNDVQIRGVTAQSIAQKRLLLIS